MENKLNNQMEENREPTAREVLIECREEISNLRMANKALQKENTLLYREKEMILSLFEKSNGSGGLTMSSDPLFDRIQRQIQLLYDGK